MILFFICTTVIGTGLFVSSDNKINDENNNKNNSKVYSYK